MLLHGAGNGMLTIARGTLPLALFGPAGYGLRTGILSAPARILQGGAPLLFGLVLDNGGPLAALMLSGALTGLSFLALFTLSLSAPAYRTAAKVVSAAPPPRADGPVLLHIQKAGNEPCRPPGAGARFRFA